MISIEEVAAALEIFEPIDWAEVLTRASRDARWSFRTIVLQPRLYRCATPIVLGVAPNGGRPLAIVGSGPADWSTSVDRGAILFWASTLEQPALTMLAPGTRIEGVKLQSQGPKLADPGFPAAIRIYGRATLRDVSLVSWRCSVAAIEIHGNGKALGTDASLSRLDQVRINGVWGVGRGVYVHGADANAGLFEQLSIANVQNASSIHDGSQLGNTWLAGHVHPSESSEIGGGVNRSPPYVADGRGSRAFFAGCYMESGTLPAQIAPPNLWVGGMAQRVAGGGVVFAESELRNIRLRAPTIVSERYDTVGLQRLIKFEVNDGPLESNIDTVEVSYDARRTPEGKPLRSTYGKIIWLWANTREVLSWSMRVARGLWSPPP